MSLTTEPKSPLLVGLDIGTTNIKAVVFDLQGRMVGEGSARTPTHYPRPGWAYYRHDEIWNQTGLALKSAISAVDDPGRIVSIAVASIGETGYPLDAQGNCLYKGIAWFDTRTDPQAAEIESIVGADKLYQITGLPPGSIYTLCKQLWLKQHEPAIYDRITTWLNTGDYIAYRLCGEAASDYSLASRMLAMDIDKLSWSESLIEAVGLNPAIFADLHPSGTRLGTLLPDIAADLGLSKSTTVAVGGHDHLCGAMAIGVTEPGILLLSIGTALGVLVPLDRPLTDPAAGRKGFEMGAHVSGGYYGMPSYRTAGVCVEWFQQTCAQDTELATLTAEAEATAPGASGVRFLPHMRLPHSPYNDARSRGAFVGLSTDVDRGAMFRAVLEGLALEVRSVTEPFFRDASIDVTCIKAIGGGTQNRLLVELMATVLKQRVDIIGVTEATALGAAMLGGIGAGIFTDVADAQTQLEYSVTAVESKQDQADLYDTIHRQVYSGMYSALRELNHNNFELKYG